MENLMEKLSLANLRGGAAVEMFDTEMARVLDNIIDINTGDGVREVVMKVKLRPDKDRSFCAVEVHVSSKLQSVEAAQSQLFLGRERGKTVAFEHNPEQLQLGLAKNTPVIKIKEA